MNSITTDEKLKPLRQNIHYFLKWTLISLVTGTVVGLVGTLFGHGIQLVTSFWKGHDWTLFLAPFAGLAIVWLYRVSHEEKNKGTDMVIESISAGEDVTAATAPLSSFPRC